jgi:DNA-binding GntR family transcriptional regulator
MHHIEIDEYVLDVLLPDLAGHDRSPAAVLVYLVLWTALYRQEQRRIAISLRQFAEATGLSKSAVQAALRLLKRRSLVMVRMATPTSVPEYELIRHWVRRRARLNLRGPS